MYIYIYVYAYIHVSIKKDNTTSQASFSLTKREARRRPACLPPVGVAKNPKAIPQMKATERGVLQFQVPSHVATAPREMVP